MGSTRDDNRIQKILYILIILLGSYILYKSGKLLMGSETVQTMLDGGEVQRSMEDAAMRTWTPGYTAAVEQTEGRNDKEWIAGWMRQIVPVYSYLAENIQRETEEADASENWSSAEGQNRGESKELGVQTDNGISKNSDSIEGQNTDESKELGLQMDNGISKNSDNIEGQSTEEQENEGDSVDNQAPDEAQRWTGDELPQETSVQEESAHPVLGRSVSQSLLRQLSDFDYLLNHYFTVDGGTSADAELLNAETLLTQDLRLEQNPDVPQILIYHTHSQEAFVDSVPGDTGTTIVGMGEILAEQLRSRGYEVLHDTGVYDLVDGVLDRSAAYDYARTSVEQILAEHPTIEVIIDLHRDGVEGKKFVTEIDGKPTSMVMFFNGISRNSQNEPLTYLENPYLTQNLAFSLQLQLKAHDQYPGFTRNIYLKAERFNLHLRPRSLLIEAGTQLNTVEEEQNAMRPLAELIAQVLQG